MDNTILLALIGIGEIVITSIVTFLLTRKKYKTEVIGGEIDNAGHKIENDDKNLSFYIKMINDNNAKLDELLIENKDMRKEVAEMRFVVFNMLSQICTDVMCNKRVFDKEKCPYYDILFNMKSDKISITQQNETNQITTG